MAAAPLAIQDLPELTELDSPDFGANFEWLADDLFSRDYQGLLRHREFGLVVYRNADLRALGTHEAVSHQEVIPSQAGGQETPGIDRFMRASTFGMQPPSHRPAKALISRRLSMNSMRRFMDTATETVDDLIDAAVEHEEIDFVQEFIKPLLARWWGDVLGLTPDEAKRAQQLVDEIILAFLLDVTDDQLAAGDRAAGEYVDWITRVLEREMHAGNHEVLSELASDFAAMGELGRPSNVCTHFGVALPDAFHTLGSVTASVVHGLLDAPASLSQVKADRSLIPDAWLEGSRLHPGVTGTQRVALRDFEYNGQVIPKGTPMLMLWLFGNRDPEVFDQPNDYRLQRDNRLWQTTFAGGFYACPGRHVARLLGEAVLDALMAPSVEIVPTGEVRWAPGSLFHYFKRMPVAIRRV